jgi:hypothetical protein
MTGKKKLFAIFALCMAIAASGCGMQRSAPQSADIVEIYTEPSESLVVNNQYALTSAYDGEAYNEPFTSYTYDFSVYGSVVDDKNTDTRKQSRYFRINKNLSFLFLP